MNKVETRVTLWFDVVRSQALSDEQKQLIRQRLTTRINRDRCFASSLKNSAVNWPTAGLRCRDSSFYCGRQVKPEPKRHRHRIPAAAKQARRQAKQQRSQIKEQRKKPKEWE